MIGSGEGPRRLENSQSQRAPNFEDFSLPDFLNSSGGTLLDRVKPFSDYLRGIQGRGEALYAREIQGPTGPRVQVRDPLTGTVREMVMMGSNNYLGLANHPELKRAIHDSIERNGTGMGGAPLLNGMSALHRTLEARIARLKGKENALLFASGFQANLGWIGALVREGDALICDELHHASLFDGLRLARSSHGLVTGIMRHNDLESLERNLKRAREKISPQGQIFVAVEGVYSMDGDLAPLPGIVSL